jgi:hypothetical protein
MTLPKTPTRAPANDLERAMLLAVTEANVHITLAHVENERDMLIRTVANQHRQIATLMMQRERRLTVSAEEARDALLKRADEDGALHGDAILEVLRNLGAR